MKGVFNTIILFFTLCAAQAQGITGRVKDDEGTLMKSAAVTLRKSSDSAIVKIGVSDSVGNYLFKNVPAGSYFIDVSHTSYGSSRSASFSVTDTGLLTVPDVLLLKAVKRLGEVVITARKPIIEVKADKLIMNVEGTTNDIGQNALELLRKSPGVTIDQDGRILLNGKNGVQIYIDGKPSPLTDKDLGDYLRTIQSNGINAIEIISNPSARYEAAGNAGIINIRLKKNVLFGTNGSVSAGYNIATYSKYNGGFALNYRDRSISMYVNYNYGDGKYAVEDKQFRKLADTIFDQSTRGLSYNKRHNFKAGIDYTINKANTVSIMVNGTLSDYKFYSNGVNNIQNGSSGKPDRILVADNSGDNRRDIINTNINYHFADAKRHELYIDGDYGLYHLRNTQLQPNLYYNSTGDTLLYSNIYNMTAPTDIDIYSLKVDYDQTWLKGLLSLGGKTSYVSSQNTFRQANILPTGSKPDSLHTNDFDYKENINALYVNYSKAFKGVSVQGGVRFENTNISGTSKGFRAVDNQLQVFDSAFHIHYGDFFPSASVTFNKSPMKQWTVNYSYRIDRPAYRDLNPFEFKVDDYTSRIGNTSLRPQYTNSIGLTFLYHQILNTTLNYSHIKDVFTVLTDTLNKSRNFVTKKNLASQDIISLNISYPLQYKWYSLFANINSYYTLYKANFGPGRTIDLNAFVLNINTDQTFALGKGWTGQLTAFYASPSIVQGTYKVQNRWSLDAGFQKSVLKNKGTLAATINDIFNTFNTRATSSFAGQEITLYNKEETRQLRLNFTYRFGNNKVKGARQRKLGVEEENRRTIN